MSVEEKAIELISKYRELLVIIPNVRRRFLEAKACAIIAVDEIIDLPVCWYSKELADKNDEEYPHSATEEYWQKVKEEINKL